MAGYVGNISQSRLKLDRGAPAQTEAVGGAQRAIGDMTESINKSLETARQTNKLIGPATRISRPVWNPSST